jgi:hypothetical protein
MSKFSIFTLFLASIIVVIIAELLVNEYVKDPYGTHLQANVLGAGQTVSQQVNTSKSPTLSQQSGLNPGGVSDSGGLQKAAKKFNSIEFETVKTAGFNNNEILQIVPFSGVLFGIVDISEFKSVPVIQNNLLQNNRSEIAIFYQFQAKDAALANEVYSYLKNKSMSLMGATINETNSFGTASFYLNSLSEKTKSFLVVKQKENVYALAYLKEYHPLVKQLIPLLF